MSTTIQVFLPEDKEKQKKIMNEMWKDYWKRAKKNFPYDKSHKKKSKEFFYDFSILGHEGKAEKFFTFFRVVFDYIDYPEFWKEFLYKPIKNTEKKKKLLKILENARDKMLASGDKDVVNTGKGIDCQIILLVEEAIKYDLPVQISS